MRIAKLILSRAIVSEHNNGATVKELAKKYDVTTQTVRNYLKEDRESRQDPKVIKQKAKEQQKKKQERDQERRNTLEARTALAEDRKKKVRADVKSGMSMHEAAEKEGLSYCTVTDYIRGDRLPNTLTDYEDAICSAHHKRELMKWAAKQPGSSIKTPDGRMVVLRAYPHILECAKQCCSGFIITTFTLGEVYYMNQSGGRTWEE